MARKQRPTDVGEDRGADSIPEVNPDSIAEVVFAPTEAMRRAKAAFLIKLREQPLIDSNNITVNHACEMAGTDSMKRWWERPGFKDWLFNMNEYATYVEYLAGLSLQTAEEILRDSNPKMASARVNLIKIISDLANKMPAKVRETQFLDSKIGKMSADELEEYIAKHLKVANKDV